MVLDFDLLKFGARVKFKDIPMASGSLVIRCTHPEREGVIIGIASASATGAEIDELRVRLRTTAHRELKPKQPEEWDFI